MRFPPEEKLLCSNMFRNGSTTSQVQEYLMDKYSCKRSSTSNFVKLIRKELGIYKPKYITHLPA